MQYYGPVSAESVLRQLLAETERPLAEAELEVHRLEERIRELQAERYGLQLALARHRGQPDHAPSAESLSRAGQDRVDSAILWQMISRAEAVERVLEESARPLTRQEVVEVLVGCGRNEDTPDAVSAALAYLQRIGRARRAGRNQWELIGPPDST